MYIAAFIYAPGEYDEEFHRLNAIIDAVAKASPGFVAVESWQSSTDGRRNATYYWRDLETLKAFSTHPAHQEAKRQFARWYAGYHIVISQVIRSYGDGSLAHATPNDRGSREGSP
jgi:heme-degrading monooxygenase HmoA